MSLNEPFEVSSRANAAKEEVKTLPLLPLRNTVLFPHLFVPLSVGRPTSVAANEAALATEDKTFLVAAQKTTESDQPESRFAPVPRVDPYTTIGHRQVFAATIPWINAAASPPENP